MYEIIYIELDEELRGDYWAILVQDDSKKGGAYRKLVSVHPVTSKPFRTKEDAESFAAIAFPDTTVVLPAEIEKQGNLWAVCGIKVSSRFFDYIRRKPDVKIQDINRTEWIDVVPLAVFDARYKAGRWLDEYRKAYDAGSMPSQFLPDMLFIMNIVIHDGINPTFALDNLPASLIAEPV